METTQSKTSTKKSSKSNPMKKIGKSIKDTFIEMSTSLAGWIDDTGAQFSGKKPKSQKSSTQKTSTMQKSNN